MIKTSLTILAATVISISAMAQTAATSIPSSVQTAFTTAYPAVTNATWSEEGGYFTPTFVVGTVKTTAYIDLKGNLIQTITHLTPAELPSAAIGYIKQTQNNAQPIEAGKIDFNGNIPPRYYAKVNGRQLLFDRTGAFIKVTASPLKQ